jgi:hypothetical protein
MHYAGTRLVFHDVIGDNRMTPVLCRDSTRLQTISRSDLASYVAIG